MNIYELIGIIIGDGCLLDYPKHRIYGLEIGGNVDDELLFYFIISNFINLKFNKKPKISIRIRPKGKQLKLVVYSKEILNIFKYEHGLNFKNKSYDAFIPEKYLDWQYSKHIIKGIFETDGCLYFSKIKGNYSYPRLEIKSASKKLILQNNNILLDNGFRSHYRKSQKYYVVYLSGKEQLKKWENEIGFSYLKNKTKYLIWKNFGNYNPKLILKERVKLLNKHKIYISNAEVPKRLRGAILILDSKLQAVDGILSVTQ